MYFVPPAALQSSLSSSSSLSINEQPLEPRSGSGLETV